MRKRSTLPFYGIYIQNMKKESKYEAKILTPPGTATGVPTRAKLAGQKGMKQKRGGKEETQGV